MSQVYLPSDAPTSQIMPPLPFDSQRRFKNSTSSRSPPVTRLKFPSLKRNREGFRRNAHEIRIKTPMQMSRGDFILFAQPRPFPFRLFFRRLDVNHYIQNPVQRQISRRAQRFQFY